MRSTWKDVSQKGLRSLYDLGYVASGWGRIVDSRPTRCVWDPAARVGIDHQPVVSLRPKEETPESPGVGENLVRFFLFFLFPLF